MINRAVVIHMGSHDPENLGNAISHGNDAVSACGFGGGGEIWVIRHAEDNSCNFNIECWEESGEAGKFLSHANHEFSLAECREGGEMFCINEEDAPGMQPLVQIKCSGGEHDYYLGHDDGEMKLIHRSEVNHENSHWRIGYHE